MAVSAPGPYQGDVDWFGPFDAKSVERIMDDAEYGDRSVYAWQRGTSGSRHEGYVYDHDPKNRAIAVDDGVGDIDWIGYAQIEQFTIEAGTDARDGVSMVHRKA